MYEKLIRQFKPDKTNLISILHTIQDNHPQQYIPEDAIGKVSDYLRIPKNQIQSVLGFYSMFSTKPRGKYIIRFCESPPCFLKGSENLLNKLQVILKIKAGQTTDDQMFTLELCACLGVCGNAPVMMINDDVYGDLTEKKLVMIIRNLVGGQDEIL
ncbi:MAG: NAD(P)H-dependent oxidoreductase subunit E [Candidatus Cloacimonetes bacterium]|nr:NAD(P)H-dependent oxidoreductase subunit E [Candidatus Cloacimonadota bacterium]